MLTRRFLAASLLILTAIGCGDSDSDAPEPEPFTCEPRPASDIEDCIIEAGEVRDRVIELSTQEHLRQVCQSKCSKVEGNLTLTRLPGVTDLTALQNIRSLGSLRINRTEDLESLKGLENVEFRQEGGTFGGIVFEGNESLKTLEGLKLPTVLDSSQVEVSFPPQFRIVANESLRSLKGLEKIEETRNVDWQITDNFVLESLDGLQNLETVTITSMTVDRNSQLRTIELPSLTNAAAVSVNFNENLEQISLPSLSTIEFLTVTNNESLPACKVDQIASQAQVGELENTGNDLNATCE